MRRGGAVWRGALSAWRHAAGRRRVGGDATGGMVRGGVRGGVRRGEAGLCSDHGEAWHGLPSPPQPTPSPLRHSAAPFLSNCPLLSRNRIVNWHFVELEFRKRALNKLALVGCGCGLR